MGLEEKCVFAIVGGRRRANRGEKRKVKVVVFRVRSDYPKMNEIC